MNVPRALTIAGSDSGGGAGIQADLKTFTALKVFGTTVITSVTAQNTTGVLGVLDLPAKTVASQFDAVAADLGADAAKIGMLSNAGIIAAVARCLARVPIPKLVLDPVMRAKGGDRLLKTSAEKALVHEILPLALIVTPNLSEAETLAGMRIEGRGAMEQAAKNILKLRPRNVLIKGGHSEEDGSADLLYDGRRFLWLEGPRFRTKNTHGTGCTLSAAIAAFLARGLDLVNAVKSAKEYVSGAIEHSFSLGSGHGPLNHFWR